MGDVFRHPHQRPKESPHQADQPGPPRQPPAHARRDVVISKDQATPGRQRPQYPIPECPQGSDFFTFAINQRRNEASPFSAFPVKLQVFRVAAGHVGALLLRPTLAMKVFEQHPLLAHPHLGKLGGTDRTARPNRTPCFHFPVPFRVLDQTKYALSSA